MKTVIKFFYLLLIVFLCQIQLAFSSLADSLMKFDVEDEERVKELSSSWEEINFLENSTQVLLPDWRYHTYPGYSLKSKINAGNWKTGILLQRDPGEDQIDDLSRVFISYSSDTHSLILGDYHINQGSGWTVSSRFRWENNQYPVQESISGNTSSEEGRGFRGGAIQVETMDIPGKFESNIDTWIGFQNYDIYPDHVNEIVFYSEQGNHTRNFDSVEERVIGSALHFRLKKIPLNIDLIFQHGDFSTPPAETQPSRFVNIQKKYSSSGLHCSYGNHLSPFMTSFEFTYQNFDAFGGNLRSIWKYPDSSFLLNIYKVSNNFSPLHARPYLEFSGPARGKTGFQTSFINKLNSGINLETSQSAEFIEAYKSNPEERKLRFDMAGSIKSTTQTRFFIRAYTYLKWQQSMLVSELKVLRASISLNQTNYSNTFRFEGQNCNRKNGALISIKYNRQPSPFLGIQLSATYLNEAGDSMKLMVVEPAAPGLFPIRMVSGQQFRQAILLKIKPFRGFLLWMRGIVTHRMDSIPNVSHQEISLGMEWRRPGKRYDRE